MRSHLIISFLSISLSAISQTTYDTTRLSPLVKKIISSIDLDTKREKWIYQDHSYFSSQLKLLQQRAKVYELVQLVNHPNPIIRINTFNFLLDSAYPRFVDILEQHLYDTTFVYWGYEHHVTPTNVIEGMLHLITWNNCWVGMFEFTETDNKRLSALIDRYWNSKKRD